MLRTCTSTMKYDNATLCNICLFQRWQTSIICCKLFCLSHGCSRWRFTARRFNALQTLELSWDKCWSSMVYYILLGVWIWDLRSSAWNVANWNRENWPQEDGCARAHPATSQPNNHNNYDTTTTTNDNTNDNNNDDNDNNENTYDNYNNNTTTANTNDSTNTHANT